MEGARKRGREGGMNRRREGMREGRKEEEKKEVEYGPPPFPPSPYKIKTILLEMDTSVF